MSYTITVTKSERIARMEAGGFCVIADTGGDDGGHKYGYPPKREVESVTNTEVYRQTVDELNLTEVIQAVNKRDR